MIKLTFTVDSDSALVVLEAFVKQARFKDQCVLSAIMLYSGYKVEIEFFSEHVFLVFVQDWFWE